ncbi:MAG TPA: SH3 domain-containing protein [Saprospiraceae bacterium]|nr:SH3 domain-containing protein [Saprospiraceae bacterium]
MVKNIWAILIFLSLPFISAANDVIFNSKAATSLNTVTLYSDSSFIKHSNITFGEGTLFEIIGQTVEEHDDDNQTQKFKWYQVRTMDGKEGWIFGDGLAVIVHEQSLDKRLKKFHKRKVNFNNGFENSVMWIASLEGKDIVHEHSYMNPVYSEFYIVITNQKNQSVHINYAGASAMGHHELKQLKVQDVTGDGVPELIFELSTYPVGTDMEYRNLEIYSMQAGTLGKIFSERMTLNYEEDMPSPALFKNIEIEEKLIRVEYVNYISCKDYSLEFDIDEINKNKERCLEYVTYTFAWVERMKMYKVLYKESHSAPLAVLNKSGVYLRSAPDLNSSPIVLLKASEQLEVIKHFENISLINGRKQMDCFLLVRTSQGKSGYLAAELLSFFDTAHAKLLNKYYAKPPLLKTEWKTTQLFLKVRPPKNGSASIN